MSKRRTINGQFAPRPIEMLRSPAMRVLSLTGHRILARIEIEQARHAGRENGRLPVTHADFREYGIDHNAVGSGLREVVALGFIEQTRRGFAGPTEHCPSLFRLTYLPTGQGKTDRRMEEHRHDRRGRSHRAKGTHQQARATLQVQPAKEKVSGNREWQSLVLKNNRTWS